MTGKDKQHVSQISTTLDKACNSLIFARLPNFNP